MFLIVGTEDEGDQARFVFVGKKAWSYNKPVNLVGFDTETEARVEMMMLGTAASVFRAVLGAPGPMSDMPKLKWVKVVEFGVRPPTPLFLVMSESQAGEVVWFGVDPDPSLEFRGLRGFPTRAAAIERKEQLRISDKLGRTFTVKELVRKEV